MELGRLACALERAQLPIFMSKHGQTMRLSVQNDLFMGVPIFYYCELETAGGEFLAYKNVGEVEEVRLVESAVLPFVHLFAHHPRFEAPEHPGTQEGLPPEVPGRGGRRPRELAEAGHVQVLYEEPPLPLYSFKNGTSWILGAFARLDDFEEASLFFYRTRTKEAPTAGFVKYQPSNLAATAFSKRADEHGFYYVKVIKLAEKHPLVEF